MSRAHASWGSCSQGPVWARLCQEAGGRVRDFSSGSSGPPTAPESDLRRVPWVRGLATCFAFLAHATIGHPDASPTPGQSSPTPCTPGYPQLAHAHSCTHLPPLLGCVCPNPADHTACTLSRHACTCVYRSSLCPSPFLLSSLATPVLCLSQRRGAGGAGSQTRGLRSGSTTLLFPFPTHLSGTQLPLGASRSPLGTPRCLRFSHFS